MAILKRLTVLILIGILLSLSGFPQPFEKQKMAFSQSYIAEKKGDFTTAIRSLKAVYDESSYELNLRIGWLSYQSGDFRESEAFYRKAVALKPYGIEARFGLILPLAAMGNWTPVAGIYEELLAIDPNNSVANYRYGLLLYNRADYLKAEKLVGKVLNLYPFDFDSLLLLGWIKLKLNKSLDAKVLFQKALLYNPADTSAAEGLSLIK